MFIKTQTSPVLGCRKESVLKRTSAMTDWHEFVGVAGFALYLLSYCLLQLDRVDGNSSVYARMILIAATLVLVSLYFEFNLASALIQISYIIISMIGLLKRARKRRCDTTLSGRLIEPKRQAAPLTSARLETDNP